ncbi:MAG: hypothetical protein JKY65_19265, partial [Planctomycetes bacterium]|nr:hypothetical protein [Planctomycetota bacterium]
MDSESEVRSDSQVGGSEPAPASHSRAPSRGCTKRLTAPDPELWLEGVSFPEPGDGPALASLEDVFGAEELNFDVEQWRAASERYARKSGPARPRSRRPAAETAHDTSRRTRALPRQNSSRRDARTQSSTGPTRRIPRASSPISPSTRTRAAARVTVRLQSPPPRPDAQPPTARPSQPFWGSTVRRESFRVSRGGLSRAAALAVTWPELEPQGQPAEPAPKRRLPIELIVLAALSIGLLIAIAGPFLLQGSSGHARSTSTGAALQSAGSSSAIPAPPAA